MYKIITLVYNSHFSLFDTIILYDISFSKMRTRYSFARRGREKDEEKEKRARGSKIERLLLMLCFCYYFFLLSVCKAIRESVYIVTNKAFANGNFRSFVTKRLFYFISRVIN